ncbi:MAG: ornithine carbamoyltransferase [Alphaproteobacteria bacterium]
MNQTIRHFIDFDDIPVDTLKKILAHAHEMKRLKFTPPQIFQGLSLAMVFDKRSTRTRMSFEIAMKQLGGHILVMNREDMGISGAENVEDTANVMSRYVDTIMIRVSKHEELLDLVRHARSPIINGMTDHCHPCQVMADMMTIQEKLGKIEGKRIAWFGDFNNMTRTFIQAAKVWNFQLVVSTPQDLKPKNLPKHVEYIEDAQKAAENADVIVTDTWVSMGQEGKAIDKFFPWQVNAALMKRAKPQAIFMHCMAIHRNEEVTDEVLATPASVVYDEAENRLHVQKSILAWCLENAGVKI